MDSHHGRFRHIVENGTRKVADVPQAFLDRLELGIQKIIEAGGVSARPGSLYERVLNAYLHNIPRTVWRRSFYKPVILTCPHDRFKGNAHAILPVCEELGGFLRGLDLGCEQKSDILLLDIFGFSESDLRMFDKMDLHIGTLREWRDEFNGSSIITKETLKQVIRRHHYARHEYMLKCGVTLYAKHNQHGIVIVDNYWIRENWN